MDDNNDIIEFFRTLVSDNELDTTAEFILLNQADAVIRKRRPWEILKVEDSSKSRTSGDTYLTAKALPSDFDRPYKLMVGTGQPPLKRIGFEVRHRYKDAAGFYYIDYKNGNYYLTNGTWAGTIYNTYIYKPAKLTTDGAASTLTSPIFPNDFWPYYAYVMAEIFMGGIDEDDRSIAAVPQWVKQQALLWDAMVTWDAELKENDLLQEQYQNDEYPMIDLGRLGTP